MYKAPNFPLRVGREVYFNPIEVGNIDLIKTADAQISFSPEVSEFASTIKPREGFMYVLVNAVSAYEFWGCNVNADAFKEEEFTIKERHKTFVTHGLPYRNHVNKDPNKTYGKVLFSAYNKRMHRVELICEYDRAKAEDICERIEKGEDVRVSMGCRVKYDICSICGHHSATTSDYCDHLRYEMKNILPDGRVVCAYNPDAVFFDISVVWIPADKSARILYKIASQGMHKTTGDIQRYESIFTSEMAARDLGFCDEGEFIKAAGLDITRLAKIAVQNKKARINKDAAIEKNIEGDMAAAPASNEDIMRIGKDSADTLRNEEPCIPDEILTALGAAHSPDKIIAAMHMLGMQPKPEEFYAMARPAFSDPALDQLKEQGMLGDAVAAMINDSRMGNADIPDGVVPGQMQFDPETDEIIDKIRQFIPDKSYFHGPVIKRSVKIIMMGPKKEAKEKKSAFLIDDLAMGAVNALGSMAASYLGASMAGGNNLSSPMAPEQMRQLLSQRPDLAGPLLYGTPSLANALMQSPVQGPLRGSAYSNETDFYRAMVKSSFAKNELLKKADADEAVDSGAIRKALGFLGKEVAMPLFMPLAATHVMSGMIDSEDKQDMIMGRSPQNGFIRSMLKEHPTMSGLMGSGLILSGKYNLV